MATREFESGFINILAEAALIGRDNFMHNEWRAESLRQYEYLKTDVAKKNKSWLRKLFGRPTVELMDFDTFVEARKNYLYSEYSTTYTLWLDHIADYQTNNNSAKRIRDLSAANDRAAVMTRLDDSEFNMLNRYAKVELDK